MSAKKMKRTNVYIDEDVLEDLKAGAARLGISESELIRRGIDLAVASTRTWDGPAVTFQFDGPGRTLSKAEIREAMSGGQEPDAGDGQAVEDRQRQSHQALVDDGIDFYIRHSENEEGRLYQIKHLIPKRPGTDWSTSGGQRLWDFMNQLVHGLDEERDLKTATRRALQRRHSLDDLLDLTLTMYWAGLPPIPKPKSIQQRKHHAAELDTGALHGSFRSLLAMHGAGARVTGVDGADIDEALRLIFEAAEKESQE